MEVDSFLLSDTRIFTNKSAVDGKSLRRHISVVSQSPSSRLEP